MTHSGGFPGEDQHVQSALGNDDRLVGERAGRFYFVAPGEVDYIEANGNFLTIHSGLDEYVTRDSFKRLGPLLEQSGFARISRSVVINLRRVEFVERAGPGVLRFMLESGSQLLSSAGYRLRSGAKLDVVRLRGANRIAVAD
jgi:two-component system LytT family response regulator